MKCLNKRLNIGQFALHSVAKSIWSFRNLKAARRMIYIYIYKITITRTTVRVLKMNAVAYEQWTSRMLSLLQKYLYRQSQNSETLGRKCLALIAQMVRVFGMNPNVGDSNPPQVETFSVSKALTLSQEHPFVCRKWMLLPTQLTFRMLALL